MSSRPPGDGLAYRTYEANPAVVALFQEELRRGLICDIHEEDEMYLVFLHSGLPADRERALVMYLASGRLIWSTLRAVIERRFGGLSGVGKLLDFAAGYGRVSRFIVQDLAPERLWVAEIDPAAVRFQERAFGVHGLLSAGRPEDLACDERFDCILVSSLFTHLPEDDFHAWLGRLCGLLNPGGLLLMSVHDLALLGGPAPAGGGGEEPPAGLVFREVSESRSLATAQYGTAWVSEGFVRSALAAAAAARGLALDVRRVPRGLVSFQDLYVVSFGGAPAPEPPPPPAEGVVEHCSWQAGNALDVRGWVVDRGRRRRPRQVLAEIDGRPADACDAFEPRPEIGALHRDPAAAGHGFRLRAPLGGDRPLGEQALRLSVVWEDGERNVLDEGPVPGALLRSARLDLIATGRERAAAERSWEERMAGERAAHDRAEAALAAAGWRIAVLEARLAAMRASRFWKLRDRWFALKRALRLTAEE